MAKKQTISPDISSVMGAAPARVEKPKANSTVTRTTTKHARAHVSVPAEATPEPVTAAAIDREEVATQAYLYWEARGFQGGSAEEDWVRAEQEVKSRTQKLALALAV
jgi:hypothetical protein